MAETVVDILGKGFKYDERIEVEFIQTQLDYGTTAAFAGGAKWGPINTPTNIKASDGKKFSSYFGTPLDSTDSADSAGLASVYYLKKASNLWYSRVSDGTDIKSKKILTIAPTAAILEGNSEKKNTYITIFGAGDVWIDHLGNKNMSSGFDWTNDNETFSLTVPSLNSGAAQTITLDTTVSSAATAVAEINTSLAAAGDDASVDVEAYAVGNYVGIRIKAVPTNATATSLTLAATTPEAGNALKTLGWIAGAYTNTTAENDKVKITFDATTYVGGPVYNGTLTGSAQATTASTDTAIDSEGAGDLVAIYQNPTAISNLSGNYTAGTDIIIMNLDIAVINYRVPSGSLFTKFYEASTSDLRVTGGVGSNLLTAMAETVYHQIAVTVGVTTEEVYLYTHASTDAAEVVDVTHEADVAGSLNNKYYWLFTSGVSHYVWYNVNSAGTDPDPTPPAWAPSTTNGLEVAIATDAIDTAVNSATEIIVGGDGAFSASTSGTAVGTFTHAVAGSVFDAIDGNTTWAAGNWSISTRGATHVKAAETFDDLAVVLQLETRHAFLDNDIMVSVIADGGGNCDIRWSSETTSPVALAAGASDDLIAELDTVSTVTSVAVSTGDHFEKHSYAEKWMQAADAEIFNNISGYTATDVVAIRQVSAEQYLDFSSNTRGSGSKVEIVRDAKLFPSVTDTTPITSVGTNTLINDALTEINADFVSNTVLASMYFAGDDEVSIATTGTGSGMSVTADTVAGSVWSDFDVTVDSAQTGSDADTNGTFEAVYTGSEGDTITIEKATLSGNPLLNITFRNELIGTFYNYSYTVADSDYIGTLMANDTSVQDVVTFTAEGAVSVVPDFADGSFSLSGGADGISGASDAMYALSLEAYKNMDLYDIDLIAVPGNISETVSDKLVEICNYRKDCFGFSDPPDNKTVDEVIDWHNAADNDRLDQLDSKYIATYYPWLLIKTFNTDSPQEWHAPSVRVIGSIAGGDVIDGSKVHAPAGPIRTKLTDIESIRNFMRDEDKTKLYADSFLNNINPISYTTNHGYFIDGQKSSQKVLDALNRIKTVRTSLHIKKEIYRLAPSYFWQPSSPTIWASFQTELRKIMDFLVLKQAIEPDYVAACDSSTNTDAVTAASGMLAKLEWSPIKSVERLKVISVIKDKQVVVTIDVE